MSAATAGGRRPVSRAGKTVNLALQGGGAHGAFTWGVLDAILDDERIAVEGISGSSAGAINAAVFTYGMQTGGRVGAKQALETFWAEISRAGGPYSPFREMPWDVFLGAGLSGTNIAFNIFDAITRTFSPYEFNPLDINPLRDIVDRCVDFEALRACRSIKLFVSATNVRSGKVKVFETDEVSLDAVMASACLPFLFKAVEIDGEHYWDGGYMGNPVLFPFFYRCGSRDVMIVHVNPIERDDVPKSANEILNRINEISFNGSLLRELRAIDFVARLLEDGWLKEEYRHRLRRILVHSIRSEEAMSDLAAASKFNVEWSFLNELRRRGRQTATAWMAANFDAIGRAPSVDLKHDYLDDAMAVRK